MREDRRNETLIEQNVTYILETEKKVILIENVPARVCLESGERFFSPETVEKIQEIVWKEKKPKRVIETPVYEFAA